MKGGDIRDVIIPTNYRVGFEYEFSIGIYLSVMGDKNITYKTFNKQISIPVLVGDYFFDIFGDDVTGKTFTLAEQYMNAKYNANIFIKDLEIVSLEPYASNCYDICNRNYTKIMQSLQRLIDSHPHRQDGPFYIVDIQVPVTDSIVSRFEVSQIDTVIIHLLINNTSTLTNYIYSYDLTLDVAPQLTFDTDINNIFIMSQQFLLNNDFGIDFNSIIMHINTNIGILDNYSYLTHIKEYIKFLCLVFISVKLIDEDSVEYIKASFIFAIRHSVPDVLKDNGINDIENSIRNIKNIILQIYRPTTIYDKEDSEDILDIFINMDGIPNVAKLPIGPHHILKVEYRYYKNDIGLYDLIEESPTYMVELNRDIVEELVKVKEETGYNYQNNIVHLEGDIIKNMNNPAELYDLTLELNALKQSTVNTQWESALTLLGSKKVEQQQLPLEQRDDYKYRQYLLLLHQQLQQLPPNLHKDFLQIDPNRRAEYIDAYQEHVLQQQLQQLPSHLHEEFLQIDPSRRAEYINAYQQHVLQLQQLPPHLHDKFLKKDPIRRAEYIHKYQQHIQPPVPPNYGGYASKRKKKTKKQRQSKTKQRKLKKMKQTKRR